MNTDMKIGPTGKGYANLWLGLFQSFSISVWLNGDIMIAVEAGVVEKHT
jgi:hypothetical protein